MYSLTWYLDTISTVHASFPYSQLSFSALAEPGYQGLRQSRPWKYLHICLLQGLAHLNIRKYWCTVSQIFSYILPGRTRPYPANSHVLRESPWHCKLLGSQSWHPGRSWLPGRSSLMTTLNKFFSSPLPRHSPCRGRCGRCRLRGRAPGWTWISPWWTWPAHSILWWKYRMVNYISINSLPTNLWVWWGLCSCPASAGPPPRPCPRPGRWSQSSRTCRGPRSPASWAPTGSEG